MRHAKSDWNGDFANDHARPLAPRGERSAGANGRFLAAARQQPQAVITSSAVRARSTVELAAIAGGWRCPVEVTDRFYEASPEVLIEAVRTTADSVERLLLAGHEPVWSATAGRLIGGGHVRMVTGAMVCIDLEVGRWADADFGVGTLRWAVTPKLLQRFGG